MNPLPKLLYLGDVPVESTVYGAALLHRLLASYPAARLLIMEANASKSKVERRLSAVRYATFPLGYSRLLNSRLHALYGSYLLLTAQSKARGIDRLIRPFAPEAVMTVTQGYSWLAAAEYARGKDLPLHLILHDDWPGLDLVFGPLRKRAHRLLAFYYRNAASRLAISPMMAQVYERELGVRASVVYPCSEPGFGLFVDSPQAASRQGWPPVIGFGGTVASKGQARALRTVANALESRRGKLVIYSPLTRDRSRLLGLDLPNIELNGLVSSSRMIAAFRNSVDALLVPVSFAERDRRQTVLSFPSKLADYTAAGLPLLIVAPEYSSVVQWARSVDLQAEIVTTEDELAVGAAIERLARSAEQRQRLASAALVTHEEFFTHARARSSFCAALQGVTSPGQATLSAWVHEEPPCIRTHALGP